MIAVRLSKTRLLVRGHADDKIVCASVSTLGMLMRHVAVRWQPEEYPKASVSEFIMDEGELSQRVRVHLLWLALEYPKHVKLVIA